MLVPKDQLRAADIGCAAATIGLASHGVRGDQPEYFVRSNKYLGRSRRSSKLDLIPADGSPLLAKAEQRLLLDDCRSFSDTSIFCALVRRTALSAGVETRALAVRVLLQLPRVASHKGWVTRLQAERELRSSAERLRRDTLAASVHVPVEKFDLRDLTFEEIDSSRALPVLASLHYLRSTRLGSRYFALVDPVHKLPVTLCSMSPLEWKCVGSHIYRQFAIPPEGLWEISRLYSVDSAPFNSISFLLSKLRTYVRHNIVSAGLLVTAVDPNLGFAGSSYRAANWQQWMTVKARPYLYENGCYVSPRQLLERYGTASLMELQAEYPGRFQQSRVKLLDSMIFCNNINGETKAVLAQDRRRLHR
jgi:hypothetical protein